MATFIGTSGNDSFGGNGLTPNGDNDSISGGDGDDWLVGWRGDDTIDGGAGNDTINSGIGFDNRSGYDVVAGGPGNDLVQGSIFDVSIDGGPGNDSITVSRMTPSTFDVTLKRVEAGDGDDYVGIYPDPAYHLEANGGAGNDWLDVWLNTSGSLSLYLDQAFGGAGVVGSGFEKVWATGEVLNVYGGTRDETFQITAQVGRLEAGAGDDFAELIVGATDSDKLSFWGGAGNDTVVASLGLTYLRGDDGNDSISGGTGFDDINGNAGADTAHGNDGDDWVVGGKDADLLFGDQGFDIVYGNLGDDTVSGGDGADWVRGGQGADSVSGGAGDDLIWGDRGDDTVSGGAGADVFHSFSGAGLDRIIDFSLAEGDRVQLDPGSVYTIKQVGSDAVIDLGGGDQVVLVGIQAATLTAASVFVG